MLYPPELRARGTILSQHRQDRIPLIMFSSFLVALALLSAPAGSDTLVRIRHADRIEWSPSGGHADRADLSGGGWRALSERVDWEADVLRFRRPIATTCDYDTPHYTFRARSAVIYPKKEWITLHQPTMWIGRVPVLWLPWLGFNYGEDRSPLRVEAGEDDFEGMYVKTRYRYQTSRFGDGEFIADWRSYRGWAYGIAPRLRGEKGWIEGRAYGLDERDRRDWRTDYRARGMYDPNARTRLRGEYHQVSDFAFRRDYFFGEHISEEEPQNVASATYRGRNWSGLVRSVANLNRGEYRVLERLPEGRIDLYSTDLGAGVLASGTLRAEALREEEFNGVDTHLAHLSSRVRFEKPIGLSRKPAGWFLTPHLEGTTERYGDADRALGEVGATLATMRSLDFFPRLPWMNAPRSYVSRFRPALALRRRFASDWSGGRSPALSPPRILTLDNLDTDGEAREISLTLDHDLVSIRPFRRLFRTLVSGGYDDARKNRPWNDLLFQTVYAPTDSFSLTADLAHDVNENVMRRLSASIDLDFRQGELGASVARANGEHGLSDVLSVGGYGRLRFTDAWEAESRFAFDAEMGRLDYASVTLRRYLHDFLLEATVEDQELADRVNFRFGVGLRVLGNRTIGPRVGLAGRR